jgi:hypothetical protein
MSSPRRPVQSRPGAASITQGSADTIRFVTVGIRAITRANSGESLMLVTFRTKSYPNVTLFGDVALNLLRAMGHSGTVPSAIMAEDVPQALDCLKSAVAAQQAAGEDSADGRGDDDESDQRTVSLAHRALPLIELLESAAKNRCNVMWDK